MHRPFVKLKIADFPELIIKYSSDVKTLKLIDFELSKRKKAVVKATALREEIQNLINGDRNHGLVPNENDQGKVSVDQRVPASAQKVSGAVNERGIRSKSKPVCKSDLDEPSVARKEVADSTAAKKVQHREASLARATISADQYADYPISEVVPAAFWARLIGRKGINIIRERDLLILVDGKHSVSLSPGRIRSVEIHNRLFDSVVIVRERDSDAVIARFKGVDKKYAAHMKGLIKILSKIEVLAHSSGAFRELIDSNDYVTSKAIDTWRSSVSEVLECVRAVDRSALHSDLASLIQENISWKSKVDRRNDEYVSRKSKEWSGFFEKLEKNPLTSRQIESILRDDTRTLVVAGAGTGKTSAVVGKIGYLLESKTVSPDKILALAFNKDAASEMRERVKERTGHKVEIRTFHAFGKKVIEDFHGKKSSVADVAADDKSRRALISRLLVDLYGDPKSRDSVLNFVVFHRYPARFLEEFDTEGDYHVYMKRKEPRSLRGELLKSFEELLIADWLTMNGILYEYEAPYEHQTAGRKRKQYRPDFYLKEYGIYLEHFGISRDGSTAPGIDKDKYNSSIEWKRALHLEHETTLVETYSWERQDGVILESLKSKLEQRGVKIEPLSGNKLDELINQREVHEPLVDLLDRFLVVCREGLWAEDELRLRADQIEAASAKRSHAFLDLFLPLMEGYQAHLDSRQEIDFTSMISQLVELMESQKVTFDFARIIVDEYQDISRGRQRILKSLLEQTPDTRIMCVGDDWQSIYGFTGSDVRMTTQFDSHFGKSTRVDLDRTFRFTEPLMTSSARFVQANDMQLKKEIQANPPELDVSIELFSTETFDDDFIRRVFNRVRGIKPQHEVWEVLFLGRYRKTEPDNLSRIADEYPGIKARFLTVHKSKGLEADVVVVLDLKCARYGFPSEVENDELLLLVLPGDESYEHAEERRLFYVAMTRAKKLLLLVADKHSPSEFVNEVAGYREVFASEEFRVSQRYHCPECCSGRLELTNPNRKKGYAWKCSLRPYCDYEAKYCDKCETAPAYNNKCLASCHTSGSHGEDQHDPNSSGLSSHGKQRMSSVSREPATSELKKATAKIVCGEAREAVYQYVKALRDGGRSNSYINYTRNNLNRLVRDIGWKDVSEIDHQHFHAWKSKTNLSPSTIEGYWKSLRAFSNWLKNVE